MAPQHGIVTRAQLRRLGLGEKAIDYRVRSGRLIRLYRGVYAVGHLPPSPHARAIAAVLACGHDAALSHQAAATLWGLAARWPTALDVTAATAHRHAGVRVHRSRRITAADVTTHFGIAVTTPARTLVDLADVLDDRSFKRAVNDARVKRLVTLAGIRDVVSRAPNRRAVTRLRPFVERGGRPTRSVMEDEFLTLVERYGLRPPHVNEVVAGHEVDMLWRAEKLIVELDSRQHHDHGQAFEVDRERDAELLAAGFRVVRVTWPRLTRSPGREAQRLARLLGDPPPHPRGTT